MKPALTELSDEQLFGRMRQGDEAAFTALYRRRQGSIYRFSLQMSGNPSVAEEVTQEVFLAVIRGAGQFDVERGNLQAWLFGAARNQVRKHLDAGWRYVSMESDAGDVEAPADGPADSNGSILDSLAREEMLDAVRKAVLTLPPHYREALVLCDLQELPYEQAALALGVGVGTVKSRLNRGRAMLAGRLRAPVGKGA